MPIIIALVCCCNRILTVSCWARWFLPLLLPVSSSSSFFLLFFIAVSIVYWTCIGEWALPMLSVSHPTNRHSRKPVGGKKWSLDSNPGLSSARWQPLPNSVEYALQCSPFPNIPRVHFQNWTHDPGTVYLLHHSCVSSNQDSLGVGPLQSMFSHKTKQNKTTQFITF